MAEEGHDVARHTAGTAAYQQDAQRQGGLEVEDLHQQPGHPGHDEELGACADEDVQRTAGDDAEVVSGQRQSHGQHDEAQDDGLCGAAHPLEGGGQEEGEDGDGDDEQRGVAGQPRAGGGAGGDAGTVGHGAMRLVMDG